MSDGFKERLFPALKDIVGHFGTPFHIYDETGIRETGDALVRAFSGVDTFREFFAVKALPNPRILGIMRAMGFGFDCSSIPELLLSRQAGAVGEDIIFTSNNTTTQEFEAAGGDGGSILNLDDLSLVDKVPRMPDLICFRYNPGDERSGNSIIGLPAEAKYGATREQLVSAFHRARDRGANRYGLHSMMASNELDYSYMVATARMLLETAEHVSGRLDIKFEIINIGGGLGIPYDPAAAPLDLGAMAREITDLFHQFEARNGYAPALHMESGRYITGPHGALIVTAINRKEIYRTYIGVDASMSALMRPGIYGAYHHIDVLGKPPEMDGETVDVVGSLCENNDKFAIQRRLPRIDNNDLLCIHDTGAHGHAMGFNYNGRLRPKELLLRCDGSVELIRREETMADYFATLDFQPDIKVLKKTAEHAA
jgi:diaminopimelate decarboxylase